MRVFKVFLDKPKQYCINTDRKVLLKQAQSDFAQTDESKADFVKNKELKYLQEDESHKLVSSEEKNVWNNKVDKSLVESLLFHKVDKVLGKDLSSNDFTDALKQKLEKLENYSDEEIKRILAILEKEIDSLSLNKANKDSVPTHTHSLINDGDGLSPYATEGYVEQNGGKIDTLSVNGVKQPIDTDKNVNIEIPDDYIKKDVANQTITGNLGINGNLTVSGTTTTQDTETIRVKDNIILTNSNGEQIVGLSGIVIRVNNTDSYAIVYNPTDDSVQLGLGKVNSNGEFAFNDNEGEPVATRIDSASLQDGQVFVWDAANKRLVGSNKYIKNTDYATYTEYGLVKLGSTYYGLEIRQDGSIGLNKATNSEIDNRYGRKAILTEKLDYAVKVGLTTNKETLTEEEKTKAQTWLGVPQFKATQLEDGSYSLSIDAEV